MQDFLQFSYFVATKSTCSSDCFHESQNWLPQKQCFLQGIQQLSTHVTKTPTCHRNLHVVTTSRSPDNEFRTKHATRRVELRLTGMAIRPQSESGTLASHSGRRTTVTLAVVNHGEFMETSC